MGRTYGWRDGGREKKKQPKVHCQPRFFSFPIKSASYKPTSFMRSAFVTSARSFAENEKGVDSGFSVLVIFDTPKENERIARLSVC